MFPLFARMASPNVLLADGRRLQPALFKNAGNSCFINATLAALFANRAVAAHLSSKRNPNSRLHNTLWNAVMSRHRPMRPNDFVQPPFYQQEQRDAQEFFSELLKTDTDGTVQSMFRGMDNPLLRCVCCRCTRRAAGCEAFTTLQLPIVKPDSSLLLTVQHAIDNYFEAEIVHGFNDWVCDNSECPHDKGIMKKHTFAQAPKVLAVQLVRWSAAGKLTHFVNANDTLQVDGHMYSLRSVIIHAGRAAASGHYYTFAKYDVDGAEKWWLHNDGERRYARPGEITGFSVSSNTGHIYMLFYELVVGSHSATNTTEGASASTSSLSGNIGTQDNSQGAASSSATFAGSDKPAQPEAGSASGTVASSHHPQSHCLDPSSFRHGRSAMWQPGPAQSVTRTSPSKCWRMKLTVRCCWA